MPLRRNFLRAAGGFDPLAAIGDAFGSVPSRDPWDAVMHVDLTTYLPGLLSLEDKLSMAHSLETRVPLLDNELVDYLLGVDWALLSDGSRARSCFARLSGHWCPTRFTGSPRWDLVLRTRLGTGESCAHGSRSNCGSRIKQRGVFQHDFVRRILDEHFEGKANHVALIWCLLASSPGASNMVPMAAPSISAL